MRIRRVVVFVGLAGLAFLAGCLQSGPQAQFTATPSSGYPPLSIEFSAAASFSPSGEIISYAWAFGDGETATGIEASHTYLERGVYSVTLTVTDSEGNLGAETRTIEALNRRPNALFQWWPYKQATHQPVAFDASSSYDEDGTIVEYLWAFGDGETGDGVSVQHAYASAGTQGRQYAVTLTVIDENGLGDSTTKYVDIVGCDTCH